MRTTLAAILLILVPLCGCEPPKAPLEPDEASPISIPDQISIPDPVCGDNSSCVEHSLPPRPRPMPSPPPSVPAPSGLQDQGPGEDHVDAGPPEGSVPGPDAGSPWS